jgi:hypothetical protein
MRAVRLAAVVLAGVAAGCARPAPAPLPSDAPRTVAVLPPANHTGDLLLVAGTSLLEKYVFHTDSVTVSDVLGTEARFQLARRGFTVVPADTVEQATDGRVPGSAAAAAEMAAHGGLPGLALWLDVRRWEPDAPTEPTFVIVALSAALIEPATGRVAWTNVLRTGPIATPGEVTRGGAYVTAARKAMERLLAPLGPERPPS